MHMRCNLLLSETIATNEAHSAVADSMMLLLRNRLISSVENSLDFEPDGHKYCKTGSSLKLLVDAMGRDINLSKISIPRIVKFLLQCALSAIYALRGRVLSRGALLKAFPLRSVSLVVAPGFLVMFLL